MPVTSAEFLRAFQAELQNGSAAFFVGAGFSRDCGLPDWKDLLRPLAEEISLEIDRESDLPAVAQYYQNERGRNRITERLLNQIRPELEGSANHAILAELTKLCKDLRIWTTNYDYLIETTLRKAGLITDVKVNNQNLTSTIYASQAVVYKMHGEPTTPVITTSDYEGYASSHSEFLDALKTAMNTRTFLFVGFSFDDTNLRRILSLKKRALQENIRHHYCLLLDVQRREDQSEAEYQYARNKLRLKIGDLAQYGIDVVLASSPEEITQILQGLLLLPRRNRIFISGSAAVYGEWTKGRRGEKLCRLLGQSLRERGHDVAAAAGYQIGPQVLHGCAAATGEDLGQYTIGNPPKNPEEKAGWEKHREILDNCGFALFLFGNKQDPSGALVDASGMIVEYERAMQRGLVMIPIGATGFTAQKLWRRFMANLPPYIKALDLERYYVDLGNRSLSNEQLVDRVLTIIERLVSPGG